MATIRQEFNQAFGEARSRGSKTFEFRGKTYGTELAKPKPKVEVGPHGPGSEEFLADGPKMRSEEKDTSPRDKNPMRSEEKDRSLKDNYPMRSEEKDTLPVDAAPMRSEAKDTSKKYQPIPTRSAAESFENFKAAPGRVMDMVKDKLGRVGEVKSNYNPGVKMTDSDRELRAVVEKRNGGMVRKKTALSRTKMAGGGAVRGAGCATKGKGKMRMY